MSFKFLLSFIFLISIFQFNQAAKAEKFNFIEYLVGNWTLESHRGVTESVPIFGKINIESVTDKTIDKITAFGVYKDELDNSFEFKFVSLSKQEGTFNIKASILKNELNELNDDEFDEEAQPITFEIPATLIQAEALTTGHVIARGEIQSSITYHVNFASNSFVLTITKSQEDGSKQNFIIYGAKIVKSQGWSRYSMFGFLALFIGMKSIPNLLAAFRSRGQPAPGAARPKRD
eukprot:TRINITY_DN1217_c5_g1_i1.p1 TRINITY_DN1217_c5_g1~~TRINITY_DN1217_c5_g1_i1.p1  ORF type:complete len:249 (+),score=105.39 TRINITY_DN1217_c5_g1_i1:51-749(+)